MDKRRPQTFAIFLFESATPGVFDRALTPKLMRVPLPFAFFLVF